MQCLWCFYFINNIDHTLVTELNLLLDNSQNCTLSLDIKQINTFASKMQNIFQQNNLLEHTQLSRRRLKTLNHGLVYNSTKPEKGTILQEKTMLHRKTRLQNA